LAECLEPLLELLTVRDPKMITLALDAVHGILKFGEKMAEQHCDEIFEGARAVDQIHAVVRAACFKPLLELLTVQDSQIITLALGALHSILRFGEKMAEQHKCPNMSRSRLLELGALEKIERLQYHGSAEVREILTELLGEEGEEGEEAEKLSPRNLRSFLRLASPGTTHLQLRRRFSPLKGRWMLVSAGRPPSE